MPTLHAFDAKPADLSAYLKPGGIIVLFGGDHFLRQQQLIALRSLGPSSEDDEFSWLQLEGDKAQWPEVADALNSRSLFGGGGLKRVYLEDGDAFVTKNRPKLEDAFEKPRKSSVLILSVETWASNTKLYKSVDKTGLQIECKPPERAAGKSKQLDEAKLAQWLVHRAKETHKFALDPGGARELIGLVGANLGMLDQDLSKLSLYATPGQPADANLVQDAIGGWRLKTVWDLVDAAADGDAGKALVELDHLLQAGEVPVAIFGQLAWSLRRFAAATRLVEAAERRKERPNLPAILEQSGFRKFPQGTIEKAQRQLIQLGRLRAGEMNRWLLELDLALKGSHSQDDRARFALEQFILKMAKATDPRIKVEKAGPLRPIKAG
jgi:DNA polymerase-3 subunit delta